MRLKEPPFVTVTNGTAVGLVSADSHTGRQGNGVPLGRTGEPCPVTPDQYHGFGLPWPISFMPSLAYLANQSQGGHYHDEPIRATNGFQE
jgi:hypothetical protein